MRYTREAIIKEIRRVASEDGQAPGAKTIRVASGIAVSDWCGIYWARWSDALQEAGLTANQASPRIDEGLAIQAYISLARRLGKLPTVAEIKIHKRSDSKFPSETIFVPDSVVRLAFFPMFDNIASDTEVSRTSFRCLMRTQARARSRQLRPTAQDWKLDSFT